MTDPKMRQLVENARLRTLERAVLLAIVEAGSIEGTARVLAESLGVSRASLFNTLARLEAAELIKRSSQIGSKGSILVTLNGHAFAKLRALCDHLCGRDGRPGDEYTSLKDEAAARRDRAMFCYRTGRGPKWLRELGEKMAMGDA